MNVNEFLQRLSDALAGERQALLENDIDGLMRHTQDKLSALRALEAAKKSGCANWPKPIAPMARCWHAGAAK